MTIIKFIIRILKLIPPLDEKELKDCDLIIEGKVLACILLNIEQNYPHNKYRYQSWIKINKIIKSNKQELKTIIVAWNDYEFIGDEDGFVGGPSDITLHPGEEVKLYLNERAEWGFYTAPRWNSAQVIGGKAKSLPQEIDQIEFA